MKKAKKLAKAQKKLEKAVRKLQKASRSDNPAWVTALAAVAASIATALSDGAKREQLKQLALDTTAKAKGLVTKRGKGERARNGIVMDQEPGPV